MLAHLAKGRRHHWVLLRVDSCISRPTARFACTQRLRQHGSLGGLSMKLWLIFTAVILSLVGVQAQAASCDRACLSALMDRYLFALDAHDPQRLPLARNVKFTENTVPLSLGDGFWQTIDRGSQSTASRLVIADPATSQVAFYGAATENGHGVLFGVRLKHRAQQITEIEQFVARRGPSQ